MIRGVSRGERALVQILVVVANIQMRTLKAEAEKGPREYNWTWVSRPRDRRAPLAGAAFSKPLIEREAG